MIVLGIDSSAVVCSAALMANGRIVARFTRNDGLTHSETLLPGIRSLYEEAKLSFSDTDVIAVSRGPGSFTGLRIGISTVKGLAVADDIPCVGISTLEALAMNAVNSGKSTVCSLMDARRNEFYFALFSAQSGEVIRLEEDLAIPAERIAERLRETKNLILVGDGAEKFTTVYPEFLYALAPENIRFQDAVSVIRCAIPLIRENQTISCRDLSPGYLRLPQAERELIERQKLIMNEKK